MRVRDLYSDNDCISFGTMQCFVSLATIRNIFDNWL